MPRSSRMYSAGSVGPPSSTTDVLRQGVPRIAFLLAFLLIVLAPPSAVAAGLREDRPNLVGGEVLGRGFALTVNYERFLTNQFGVGAGFMMIGTSEGLVGVVPMYASFLTGNAHSLYLGGGATFLTEGGVEDYESALVLQGSIGYHYQSASGFFVRPIFTLNVDPSASEDFLIWPGITIGGSF